MFWAHIIPPQKKKGNLSIAKLERAVPHSGSVRALIVTEKQFASMKILCGSPAIKNEKKKSFLQSPFFKGDFFAKKALRFKLSQGYISKALYHSEEF